MGSEGAEQQLTVDDATPRDGAARVKVTLQAGAGTATVTIDKAALIADGGGVDAAILDALVEEAFVKFDRDRNGTLEFGEFAEWASKSNGVQSMLSFFS